MPRYFVEYKHIGIDTAWIRADVSQPTLKRGKAALKRHRTGKYKRDFRIGRARLISIRIDKRTGRITEKILKY